MLTDVIQQLTMVKYWYRPIPRARKSRPNIGKSRRLRITIALHSLVVKG